MYEICYLFGADIFSSALAEAEINLDPYEFIEEQEQDDNTCYQNLPASAPTASIQWADDQLWEASGNKGSQSHNFYSFCFNESRMMSQLILHQSSCVCHHQLSSHTCHDVTSGLHYVLSMCFVGDSSAATGVAYLTPGADIPRDDSPTSIIAQASSLLASNSLISVGSLPISTAPDTQPVNTVNLRLDGTTTHSLDLINDSALPSVIDIVRSPSPESVKSKTSLYDSDVHVKVPVENKSTSLYTSNPPKSKLVEPLASNVQMEVSSLSALPPQDAAHVEVTDAPETEQGISPAMKADASSKIMDSHCSEQSTDNQIPDINTDSTKKAEEDNKQEFCASSQLAESTVTLSPTIRADVSVIAEKVDSEDSKPLLIHVQASNSKPENNTLAEYEQVGLL